MAIHNNDFGGVGINAAFEIARNIARRDAEAEADQPVDFAALARLARKPQSTETTHTAPSMSRRATQPIVCPEPNA